MTRTQPKMFAAVRSAITTAMTWMEMAEEFPDRAWTGQWRAH